MKVNPKPLYLRRSSILFLLFNFWLFVLYLLPNSLDIAANYFQFIFLGVLGAIFANSTGAGGGVVFIPAFNQFGFTDAQAVATSFGIQCFGMTAGAITWWRYYRNLKRHEISWQSLPKIALLVATLAISGVLIAQVFNLQAPSSLKELFKSFSVVLGIAILLTAYLIKGNRPIAIANTFDYLALGIIALFGGVITHWLSVGVGELVAMYLILRRFDVTMSIAIAVIISAFTVWSASIQHIIIEQQAYWQVVLFAGPGAIIGGILARTLVGFLPAKQLKMFFGIWVLVIGIFS